jgi:hypothetical protein
MTRRVRTAVAALFALSLILQAPVAFAAGRERDRDFNPGFIQRVVGAIKQVLKPFMPATNDDDTYYPTPPRP